MKPTTNLIMSILHGTLGLLLALASVAAHAQANSIESINVSPATGGKVVVKVTLKQAPASPPAGFTVNNPPRIAFDFPNTTSALGRSTQEVSEGELRSINVVQAGDRTRLVLNLSRSTAYDTQIDGRALLITLQGAAAAESPSGATTHFAEAKPADSRHALRDVDFRRGDTGEGRVVIDLSDNAVGIDLRLQGKTIVIDFINTALPKNLQRRLDVTDFGTPVQTIDGLKVIVEGILKKHGVRYTLEWYVSGEPFYTPPGALSAGVARAIEAETGARPKFSTGGGTSDGRFIATLGSQVVECGVINATIHKVNESVNVADIDRLHRIYLNALKEMLA